MNMITNDTLEEILKAAAIAGFPKRPESMTIEVWKAGADSHIPKSLKKDHTAVYVYTCGAEVLKVGQCGGKNSYTCYVYRHYNTKHPSTLAKSLLKDGTMAIGIQKEQVAQWIKENTTRYNIHIPVSFGNYFTSFVEGYLILKLQPRFERYGDGAKQVSTTNPE